MADAPSVEKTEETAVVPAAPAPHPRRRTKVVKAPAKVEEKTVTEEPKEPRVPRRAVLDPSTARALTLRRQLDARRPRFVRQAAHRYARVGREGSWRRPRGLQSKQRRHYGYRPVVVSVGYRSPARSRGLVPSGFRPVRVETPRELERLNPLTEAAVLARGIGTRRRLVLEEVARRRGLRVLNPIATPESEE